MKLKLGEAQESHDGKCKAGKLARCLVTQTEATLHHIRKSGMPIKS